MEIPRVPYSSVACALAAHARDRPAELALRFDGAQEQDLSLLALDRQARAIAASLNGLVGAHEVVLLPMRNDAASVAALCGCFYAGVACAPTPIPGRGASPDRLRAFAEASGARVALAPADALHLRETAPELRWLTAEAAMASPAPAHAPVLAGGDDVALVQFTSGSTRFPKGVRLTHANLVANLEMLRSAFQVDGRSRFASWLPLFHDMGLAMLMMPLYFGVPGVLMTPMSFLRRPVRWMQMVQRFGATITGAPNFAYELCARRVDDADLQGLDLACCRLAFCGAEPVRQATLARFAHRFADAGFRAEALYPCYGMAEAVSFVSGGFLLADGAALDDPARMADAVSCGRPADGSHVVVVDPETLLTCEDGAEGEVWVCGPHVASGYWRDAEASDGALDARLPDDPVRRYLRTGDLGWLRDGELTITGRLKDLIIHRGANIHAVDVEAVVAASHPGFADTGATFAWTVDGEEQAVHLQEVTRRAAAADVAQMRAAAFDAVALHHSVRLHDLILLRSGRIPRTTSGKVRRDLCRTLYAQGALKDDMFAVASANIRIDCRNLGDAAL